MKEFDFIKQYLYRSQQDHEVLLGIGDDAAIVRPRAGYDWCVSSDMLLVGRHFFADVAPADLAHKALAVNLSDMAAMGAIPRWVVLSVALPELQPAWLTAFCEAFFQLCQAYGVTLIGGDTTKGALTINITIMGELPTGQALRRDAAQVGDDVWVSGQLGLAAAALQHKQGKIVLPPQALPVCEAALLRPTPRVALGQALLSVAHAAQDVSDGLAQDVGHIAQASGVGVCLAAHRLPILPELAHRFTMAQCWQWALSGGDDYELVFTAPVTARSRLAALGQQLAISLSRVGYVTAGEGVQVFDEHGAPVVLTSLGFNHFD